MSDTRYAKAVDVPLNHDEAIGAVTELLKAQGFGVLTTIDVKATLKAKLGVDVAPQTILGACNPPFAHQAMEAEDAIAVLLPCNVAVKERVDGTSTVFITDVHAMFSLIERDDVAPLADAVGARLDAVAEGLRALSA